MIVTKHEMEIIELLQDTINGCIKMCDLLNNIHHSEFYTKQILMSLKLKNIIELKQLSVYKNIRVRYVFLREEYQ